MKQFVRYILLACAFLIACAMSAQSVDLVSYYAAANGKKKAELKTAMYHIIGNPETQSYGSLWFYYYQTDRLPDNQVIDRYSNVKRYFSENDGIAVSGMNKEHGIAQSWWGGGTDTKQGCDLHHVMPSDIEANGKKSNYGMGVVTSVDWDNGSIKVGSGKAGNNGIVPLWEPADEWKGDFARAYFYIVTCYEGVSLIQKQGANSMQDNTYPKLQPWAYQLYLKWAKEDPVSDLERARNEAVYQIQGNRNPFIDYQTLAEYIWGDSIDYAFDVSGGHGIDPIPGPQPVIPDSLSMILADFTEQPATDYDFTIVNAQGDISNVWANSKNYGMVANAYNLGKTGDEWLISPAIDLAEMQGATLEFTHATGYNATNDPAQMFEVLVSADFESASAPSAATWTALHPNWPESVSSGYTKFVSSGKISLDGFAGQCINVAFRYQADASRCWAWEVKDVTLKAKRKTKTDSIADYYSSAQGLRKAELKTALHHLIQPAMVLTYGGKGEGYTWSGFAKTDVLPDGYVRDRYSNIQRSFNGLQAVDGMNIEHIWANSWWGHVKNNAYCDLFNLYPSDASANQRKSNNPIGIVDGSISFDNGVTKVGKSSSYRTDSLITAWEPADEWKGDFARTYFYMATAYEHMIDLWQTTEGLLTVDPSASWPLMRPWVYQLMLEWANADPVDDIERERNAAIYAIQGNRNPYVDMPQLAQYVWGDSTEYAFYINPSATTPELFVPRHGTVLDLGLQSLQTEMNHKIAVRGRNLKGGLTVRGEGDGFEVLPTTFSADEIQAGAAITVRRTATEVGTYTATLTLSDGNGLTHSVTLQMEVMDGIPAYEPSNIVCSINEQSFTARWKDMALTDGATYSLDVYTKDEGGTRTSVSGFPVTTTDTAYVVSGLKASTTYYYQVSNSSFNSNEVRVDMPAVKPVFSVSKSSVALTALPEEPSREMKLSVTTLAFLKYEVSVSCPSPFEVSADGENWTNELLLTTYNPSFYVRLGAVATAGIYENEMILTAPDVDELVVSLSAVVDENKAFFENFESGTKTGYAEGVVTCNAAAWTLANALIAADGNARDGHCVRMKIGGRLEMNEDKPQGCDSLSFYAGLYNKDTKAKLTVSYSLNGGLTWTPVVEALAFKSGEFNRYVYPIQQDGLIRLRFSTQEGNESQRLNIDDIQMSNYVAGNALRLVEQDCNVDTVVYTLDGRPMGDRLQTQRGFYLIRQGGSVRKIIIK